MNCHFTRLTSATKYFLTKSFSSPDLKAQPSAVDKVFNVNEEPIYDVQSLSKLPQRLEGEPTRTIIRRLLVDDAICPVLRNKETRVSTPRQWCMIDIDSLAWHGGI